MSNFLPKDQIKKNVEQIYKDRGIKKYHFGMMLGAKETSSNQHKSQYVDRILKRMNPNDIYKIAEVLDLKVEYFAFENSIPDGGISVSGSKAIYAGRDVHKGMVNNAQGTSVFQAVHSLKDDDLIHLKKLIDLEMERRSLN